MIETDFTGDGTTDWNTSDISTTVLFTYSLPGVYTAKFTVTDNTLKKYYFQTSIVVLSVASIDTLLRNVYEDTLVKLKAGDIKGALTAFTGGAQKKYSAVFAALGPNLPAAVDQLGLITDGEIGNSMAEYKVVRGYQTFFIYFILDEDGVWRIDGM